VDETKTFREFLEEVKENTLNAFDNQEYPFEELVKKLGKQGIYNRNPVFDTVFTLQNLENEETWGNLVSDDTPYEFKNRMTPFDLSFVIYETKYSITAAIVYKTALFKLSTLEKILGHYVEILRIVLEDGEIKLKDISLSCDLLDARVKVADDEYNNFGF
jgi:non-ribosomal peptide synthetase component F